MKKILVPFLTVILLVTGYFAYDQYQSKEKYVRRAESQYQKNFHELVFSMDNISSQLAQTLVSSSPKQVLFSLTNLWKQSFSAHGDLGGIPVAMIELDRTENLLSDVSEYSYYLLKKNNLEKKELTEKEWNRVQDLYKRCKVIGEELHQVESSVINQDLSFVDLETLSMTNEKKFSQSVITKGFNKIEDKVKAFPELEFDEGVQKIEPEPRPIKGKEITEEQAKEIAKKFMHEHDGPIEKLDIAFKGQGKIPTYGVKTYKKGEKVPTYVAVTKKGGHVIQMYMERKIKVTNIDEKEALNKAKDFLGKHGFDNIVVVDEDANTNLVVFTFVPTQNGIMLYSDMIKVEVALDNGQITSFDQTSYLSHHYERKLSPARITAKQVSDNMNPNFKIITVRPAIIPSEYEKNELFTYEVRGTIDNETFIIFVNALTGEDERIVRLTKPRVFPIKVR